MKTWRYVAARRIIDGEELWDIREYYEDEPPNDDGIMWTVGAVSANGDSLDGLRLDLMKMLKDTMDPREFLDLDGDKPGLEPLP